jgi:hypothetical protein
VDPSRAPQPVAPAPAYAPPPPETAPPPPAPQVEATRPWG